MSGPAASALVLLLAGSAGDPRAEARVRTMPPAAFDRILEATVARQREDAKAVALHWKEPPPRPPPDQVDAAGIGGASTLTAIDLAKASVAASVDGAEAGVSLAPFPLLGWDTGPHQAKVALAALQDGVTRFGLGYAHERPWAPSGYADLGLDACPFDAAAEEELRRALAERRAAFRDACEILVAAIPAPPAGADARDRAGFEAAQGACGFGPAGAAADTLGNAVAGFDRALQRAGGRLDPGARASLDARAELLRPQLEHLRAFQLPSLQACHADEIADAYARTDFSRARFRWGVGGQLDLFPIAWGFDPAPSSRLAHGEPARWLARAEVSYRRGRGELVAGLGAGGSRAAPRDALHAVLSPSLAAAWAVGAIGRDRLYQDGQVRVQDGAVVPRVNVGLIATADVAPRPPTGQHTHVEAVSLTGYADFVLRPDVTVRLGVPLTGKLVSTPAGVTPRRADLQWSVPGYVAMVLSR